MLNVQQKLLEIQEKNPSFSPKDCVENLANLFSLDTPRYKNNLVVLNYDQINSPKNKYTDECRGLILRLNSSFDVVSFSFKRFYNFNEGFAAPIDWDNAYAYKKLDGTFVVFYHNGSEWDLQTRKTVDASGPLPLYPEQSFRERVLQSPVMAIQELEVFSLDKDHLPCEPLELTQNNLIKTPSFYIEEVMGPLAEIGFENDLDSLETQYSVKDFCFVFEYVGPYNAIITPYSKEALYLLDIVNKKTFQSVLTDQLYEELLAFGVNLPKRWKAHSINDCEKLEELLSPKDEGFVVKDGKGKRVKIKQDSYLALHRCFGGGNPITLKNMIAVILAGVDDDFCSIYPIKAKEIESLKAKIKNLILDAQTLFDKYSDLPRHMYALKVSDHPLAKSLFDMYTKVQKEKVSLRVQDHLPDDDKFTRILLKKFS